MFAGDLFKFVHWFHAEEKVSGSFPGRLGFVYSFCMLVWVGLQVLFYLFACKLFSQFSVVSS